MDAVGGRLSAGFVEITEITEMTKTTGIQGANHGFRKPQSWKYPTLDMVKSKRSTLQAMSQRLVDIWCIGAATLGMISGFQPPR